MKIELYSVKDVLVGFSAPFGSLNDAVAIRSFAASCQSSSPNFCNVNPEDKQLYHVGTFDDQSGQFTNDLRFLAEAKSFVILASPVKPVSSAPLDEKKDL